MIDGSVEDEKGMERKGQMGLYYFFRALSVFFPKCDELRAWRDFGLPW